ncbi:MAG TPA: SDR family NAD(P)-dependent oxidoreductase [Archangium sp.]|uniref:SDR family NAD(P)-dependent oxidoreductase n=1 Tax=Archangium sp. TaxID=1872627 RepID=UPI002E32F20F|nr:SDR family NAD(P)-dependent oxidoreductase [Archangium sp.]HEX5748118.1 SDR family NAD(P)-dependent oxidoreductase [Archangium sp.]
MKNQIRDILTHLGEGRLSMAAAREALDQLATASLAASPALYGDAWSEAPAPPPYQAAAALLLLDDEPTRRDMLVRACNGIRVVAAPFAGSHAAEEQLGQAPSLDVVIAPPVPRPSGVGAGAAHLQDLLFELVERVQRLTRGGERTCRVLIVLPDVPIAPMLQRALGALSRTVQSEHPLCSLRAVITATPDSSALLAELMTGDVEVRQLAGRRLVRTLKPVPPLPTPEWASLEGRVALVSGGFGAIGRLLAKELAGCGMRVALVGRHVDSSFVDQRRLWGFTCDIRDREDVLRTTEAIRRELGGIHIVVHAAAALQDGLLRNVTRSSFDLAFGAKFQGALHLAEATQADALTHFVAFSSLAGVLGHLGQTAYAMANALLDGWIQTRAGDPRGTHFLSLAWPEWQGDGLRMSTGAASRAQGLGLLPMPGEAGLELFHASLGAQGRAWAVAYGDASKFGPYLQRLGAEAPVLVTSTLAAPGEAPEAQARVEQRIAEVLVARLGLDPSDVRAEKSFDSYGVDSITAVNMVEDLERDFGRLPKTLFFEWTTARDLAVHLVSTRREAAMALVEPSRPPPAPEAREQRVDEAVSQERPGPVDARMPIAIIGIAGRYPGSPELAVFFDNLRAGRDLVTDVPEGRFSPPVKLSTGRARGGFLDDIARFDARFFGISGREAERIDPQERLFLEVSWEALDNAAITRRAIERLNGSVGVFVGAMFGHYQLVGAETWGTERPTPTDSSFASIANRVSYVLNLTGPSMAVDTMCSSSLTAIHLAAESLRRGECRMALAGGVNVMSHPSKYVLLEQAHFLSTEGLCRSFGRGGNGYVPGEGVGAVVLKPLADAMRDGDQIIGVLRGSSLNHGGRTNHYTVPSPTAQAQVIRDALARADVEPGQIGYVEAHGTGTALGDPIEVRGLSLAFEGAERQRCALGSVKSNIGHLESAAGIAGLTKVLLQFQHETLVPTLHAEEENPLLELESTPFYLVHREEPWRRWGDAPLRACLSSFGAGGSNAHLVLEEAPARVRPSVDDGRPLPFLLSARTDAALVRVMERAMARCQDEKLALVDIAHTLARGREHFERRVGFVASSRNELVAAMRAWLANPSASTGPKRDEDLSLLARSAERAEDAASARRALQELVAAYVRDSTRGIDDVIRGGRRLEWPAYPFMGERHWLQTSVRPPSTPVPVRSAERPGDSVHEFVPVWKVEEDASVEERRRVMVIEPAPLLSRSLAGQHELVSPEEHATAELAVVRLPIPTDDSADAVQGVLGQLEASLDRWPGIRRWLVVPVAPEASRQRWTLALSSLARVIGRERSRELVVADLEARGRFEALGALVAAFGPERRWGPAVRVKDGARWTLGLKPHEPLGTGARFELPRGGHVILTGGLGGIGLHVATWLRQRFDARILLLGRSAPGAEALARLRELGDDAHVRYVRCDVSDRTALEAVLQEERRRVGPFAGAFHSAGVQRDGILSTLDGTARAAVLAPKIDGARWLDELTANEPLECFVLFGSLAMHLGGVGQSVYAAANGYLAGFAQERFEAVRQGRRRGTTLCIDWPLWKEGGMRADPETERALEERYGLRPLPTGAGLEALGRLLASGQPEVAVVAGERGRIEALLMGRSPADSRPAPVAPKAPSAAEAPLLETVRTNERDIVAALLRHASTYLKIPLHELEPTTPFADMGLDSIGLKELATVLSSELGIALAPGAFFEFQHAEELARAFAVPMATAGGGAGEPSSPSVPREPAVPLTPAPVPASALLEQEDAIAIVGAAGRFPGSDDLEAFFAHLREGNDLIRDVPADRWNAEDHPTLPRQGGYLDDVRRFDADYFRMSPTEAALLDPQHRLFLETVIHALENGAIAPRTLAGRSVGVFAGVQFDDYRSLVAASGVMHPFAATGNAHAMLPNRVSHWLDIHGPSEAVDTACSSALVAVARAIDALRTGRCELAIAGGVSLVLSPDTVAVTQAMGILSPDARCKVLSARANGYVKGEGVGVVVLKPLARALADGDPVRAVIRAAGVNHGGRAKSLTAPNPKAQAALLRMTYEAAQCDPASVGYLELHGTGTELGDPIEVEAIRTALGDGAPEGPVCWMGSVKSNIGHLEPAAGIAGLLKAMMALEHGEIPPSLHSSPPNPYLQLAKTRYRVAEQLVPWPRPPEENGKPGVRRAGVSSFGFGGTYAHVLLEEAPATLRRERADMPGLALFAFSAKSAEALLSRASGLLRFLRAHPDVPMLDVATTLAMGRDHDDFRAAIVTSTREELEGALEALVHGTRHPRLLSGAPRETSPVLDELHARLPEELAAAAGEVRSRKLLALGDLYTRGYKLPKAPFSGRRIRLPGYPFARTPHWVDVPAPKRQAVKSVQPPASARAPARPETGGPELVVATPVWHGVPPPPPTARRPGRVLVVHAPEHAELARVVAGRLPGAEVFFVDHFDPVSLDSAVLQARAPTSVLFLSGLDATPLVSLGEAELANSQRKGIHALFHLVKALHRYGFESEPLELRVLVNDVEGASASTAVGSSSLVGFVGSLAKEHPAWSVVCADVPWAELVEPEERAERLQSFLDEPADPQGALTRLSGRLRLRRAWRMLDIPGGEARCGYGTTFLLGGAGGLGLAFAEHLARQGPARIALVGRSEPNARAKSTFERLRGQGHTVLYLRADARDRASLAGAMARARAELGPIDTVVHSALVLRDRTLRSMDLETLEDVLSAKTRTGMALLEACRASPPKRLLFFSSAQATRADGGQANYAAGSTFIDALARAAETELPATRVVTVDWGYWGSVGVVANEAIRDRLARLGIGSIEPEDGFGALDRLVSAGIPRALVVRATPQAQGPLGIEPPQSGSRTEWVPAPRLVEVVHALPEEIRRFESRDAEAQAALGAFTRASLRRTFQAVLPGFRNPDELRDRITVAPAYERLWACIASMLARGPELEPAKHELLSRFPSLTPHVALLEATLPQLPEVLSGRLDPASVLFPGGSADLLERVYTGNPVVDHGGRAIANVARALVEARAKERPVVLLEIGAGTGGTSRHVLEALPSGLPWTYRYTDISHTLLTRARSRFGRPDGRVLFERLDIEAPPSPELEGTADIVIATNVLHATRSLAVTLSHAARLLRPSGVLLLQEVTTDLEFATLTFGLTQGWWQHEDVALRQPGGPLAKASTWRALLESNGFASVVDVTHDHPSLGGQRVLAAERRFETGGVAQEVRRPEPLATPPHTDVRVPASSPSSGSPPPPGNMRGEVIEAIVNTLAEATRFPPERFALDQPFVELGIDSLLAVDVITRINRALGTSLRATDLYNFGHVNALADHLLSGTVNLPPRQEAVPAHAPAHEQPPAVPVSPVSSENPAPRAPPSGARGDAPIAIIGISGRFAGTNSVEELSRALGEGRVLVGPRPAARGEGNGARHPAGYLNDVARFDARFFQISGREALLMDPQQRLLLEESWKAIEHAGYAVAELRGRACGVFVGAFPGDYRELLRQREGAQPEGYLLTGNSEAMLAGRVAYALDLHGPAVTLDTACSSSLVALHLACESLRSGSSEVALVGGVTLFSTPQFHELATTAGMLSPEGRCFTFDARANGFVPAEAVAVAVLKPLERALADGDNILGVVLGSEINQDGRTNGITAPSATSQAELIRRAHRRAGVTSETIDYVETHGTGTRLGDPIEVSALLDTFGASPRAHPCVLGAVKANVGHALPASGLVSLAKVLTAFEAERIPAQPGFERENPLLELPPSTFVIPRTNQAWPRTHTARRRAGISAFGFSGTNAHVVLEEAPPRERPSAGPEVFELFVSARTGTALVKRLRDLHAFVSGRDGFELADLCFTANRGREHFERRTAFVFRSRGELSRLLEQALAASAPEGKLLAGEGLENESQNARRYMEAVPCRFDRIAGRRIPLPTYPFEGERYWASVRRLVPEAEQAVREVPSSPIAAVLSDADALIARGAELRALEGPFQALEVSARRALAAMLVSMGILDARARPVERILREAEIAPAHHRLVRFLLETLTRAGLATHTAEGIASGPATIPTLAQARLELTALDDQHTAIRPHRALLSACLDAYPEVLCGTRDPVSVMFPEGSTQLVEGVYRGNAVVDHHNALVASFVRSAVERLGARRVLEVGAGTGGTTSAVLPCLDQVSLPGGFEYVYTDISSHFLRHGERAYGNGRPYLRFSRLDIETDPEPQGFDSAGFDVVLATNVLHATKNIEVTMRHVRRLLRPGGLLIVNELVRREDYATITFGLTKGWWAYEDEERRIPGSPLLAPQAWTRLLGALGFEGIQTASRLPPEALAAAVFVASAPSRPREPVPPTLPRTEREAPAAPPPAAMASPEDHAFVRAQLSEALMIPESQIGDDTPFATLGVDSLVSTQVLKPLSERFGPLPPNLLFEQPTLAELAAFLAARGTDEKPARVEVSGTQADEVLFQRVRRITEAEPRHELVRLDAQRQVDVYSIGSGQPLVLLPPLNTHPVIWLAQIEGFAADRRIVIPSYAGHGRSSFHADRASFTGWTRDLLQALERTGVNAPFDLVGWSLGGCFGQLLASEHQPSIRSLTLVSTAMHFAEAYQSKAPHIAEELTTHQDTLRDLFGRDVDTASLLQASASREALGAYQAALASFDTREMARRISAASLVLVGNRDGVLSPDHGRALGSVLPSGELVELDGAGHFLPLTAAARTNRLLVQHLTRTREGLAGAVSPLAGQR